MAIQHTITALAADKSLTLDELQAFIDVAVVAGASMLDTVVTSVGFGSALRQVAVTVDEPTSAPQQSPQPAPTPVPAVA